MIIYTYDGTFDGFLTSVFDCYKRNEFPVDICTDKGLQKYPFAKKVSIQAVPEKALRVWEGIQNKMNGKNKPILFYAFLSEKEGIEMKIYRFLRRFFSEEIAIETDYDKDFLFLIQQSQKVKKEAIHWLRNIRFQRTKNQLYFFAFEPRFDIIPLVLNHFKKKFADKKWMLYDLKRNYGVLFQNQQPEEVEISFQQIHKNSGEINKPLLDQEEDFYQKFCRSYFKNSSIQEEKNLRLQRHQLPRRFLKYISEIS